jgi:hypothetical protein
MATGQNQSMQCNERITMKTNNNSHCLIRLTGLALIMILVLAACAPAAAPTPAPTPTIDPAIYNQVPDTTVFEPGQCKVTLSAPAPAYTSNTIGGVPSGQIAAGTYEVGVAAEYSTSLWYGLNTVGTANYINSAAVTSTTGDCTVNK